MSTTILTLGASSYRIDADWSQASSQIMLDGRSTGKQVADYRHSNTSAERDILEDAATADGLYLNDEETQAMIKKALENAIELPCSLEDLPKKIKAAIDDEDEAEAVRLTKLLKTCAAAKLDDFALDTEVVTTGTDTDDQTEDVGDEVIYVTETRKLVIIGIVIAEWTICACGRWGNSGTGVPGHDWDVSEATEGGDGIDTDGVLYAVLSELSLEDEATQLPDIAEPAKPEEKKDGEWLMQVKCTFDETLSDGWETKKRYATEADAEKAVAAYYRDFSQANGPKAYGWEARAVHIDHECANESD